MRRGLSAVGAAALGGALIASGGPAWAATTVTSNAFAVGSVTAASGGAKSAVAVRWNGSAWSQLAVPKPAGTDTEFTAVKAFSATDVWAVGDTAPAGSTFRQALTMHDNGATWSTSATPSPGTRNNTVTAVDGVSGTDAWAVGYTLDLPYGNRIRDSLILHWNGTAWTQVPSPNNGSTYLYDVAAVSANEAWAVGYGSTAGAFVLRWNGTAWNAVAAPALFSLSGVAARSGTDVWVTGADAAGAPALAHWNGTGWSVTPVSVTGGAGTPALTTVAVVDPTTEWAVGYQQDATTGQGSAIAFRVAG